MGSEATTNSIRISASALFVPEKSERDSYFFSYCMRMSVVGEGPELRVLHAALRDPRLGTGPRVRARRGGLQ